MVAQLTPKRDCSCMQGIASGGEAGRGAVPPQVCSPSHHNGSRDWALQLLVPLHRVDQHQHPVQHAQRHAHPRSPCHGSVWFLVSVQPYTGPLLANHFCAAMMRSGQLLSGVLATLVLVLCGLTGTVWYLAQQARQCEQHTDMLHQVCDEIKMMKCSTTKKYHHQINLIQRGAPDTIHRRCFLDMIICMCFSSFINSDETQE